jgi:hypothetical protein
VIVLGSYAQLVHVLSLRFCFLTSTCDLGLFGDFLFFKQIVSVYFCSMFLKIQLIFCKIWQKCLKIPVADALLKETGQLGMVKVIYIQYE